MHLARLSILLGMQALRQLNAQPLGTEEVCQVCWRCVVRPNEWPSLDQACWRVGGRRKGGVASVPQRHAYARDLARRQTTILVIHASSPPSNHAEDRTIHRRL